jgi:hypothetical protein
MPKSEVILPGDSRYDEARSNAVNNWNQSSQQSDQSQTEDYGSDVPDSDRTYWENPQKIVEWHTMNQTAKSNPSMKIPDGIPIDQIEQAYNYMSLVYKDTPVAEWKPPKENDPLRTYLKQIPQIPVELMPPADRAEWESKISTINQTADVSAQPISEVGDWNKLELDRQIVLSVTGANADPNLSNRPDWTRAPATLVQGVMGGIAPAMVATAVGTPLAGALAFLAFGGIAAYQAYTGERIPLISDIYDKFQIPAKALESGIGQLSLDLTPEERMNNILPNAANVVTQLMGGKETPVMAAGRLKYETSKPIVMDALIWSLDTAYNLGVETAGLFGGGWKKVQIDQAGEGYRWDINKGINDPVKITGTVEDAALNEYWDKLKVTTPENFDRVLAEVDQDAYDRFGYSGVLNDLVGQTILDPLNFAPFMEGLGAEKVGKLFARAGVAPEFMSKFADVAARSRGNPFIDVLPIGVQQVAEAIMRGKGDKPDFKPFGLNIGDLGKRSASTGLIGTIEATKREIRAGTYFGKENPVNAAELSRTSKQVAGLTTEGKYKELEPVQHLPETGVGFIERQKNRWINWQRDMFNLTPEAQGLFAETTLKDNLQAMAYDLSDTEEDVVRNVELLSRAGDSERVQQTYDAVQGALNTPEEVRVQKQREALVNSPTAATVADSLDYGVKNAGSMLPIYRLADGNRATLDGLSRLVGETTADIVKRATAEPEAYFKEISLKPGVTDFLTKAQLNNGNDLKTYLGVFTGKDAVALNKSEFIARYINAITDKAGEYLVKKYNIKPQSKAMQIFGLMKDVQSLLVLGLNPGYFINNMLNNVISRAVQGVFGFQSRATEDSFWGRMGFSPSRLNTGIGASGEGTQVGGMSVISRAVLDKGTISNMRRSVKDLAHKIGIFQGLSQKVEERESALAFTIGTQIMRRKLAKVDVGYDRLPANVEKVINERYPGLLDRMYSGIENSLNMDEIRAVVNSEFIPVQVKDVFNKVIDEIYSDPENPARADTVRDLISWIGIEDDLQDTLSKAKTPEDVNAAINKVKSQLQENIDDKLFDSLNSAAAEVQNITQAEGTLAIINIKAHLDELLSKRYLDHFKVMSDANNTLRDATFEQRTAFRKVLNDQEAKKFMQDHAKETAVYTGLANSGISHEFTQKLGELNKLSEDFFTIRNRRYNEVFEDAVPGPEFERKYAALQNETDANYLTYNAERTRLLAEMDNRFYDDLMQRNPDPTMMAVVQEWRAKVLELEVKRQKEMESIRKKLTAEDATGIEREQLWDDFHKTYDPLVMDISNMNNEYANKVAAVYQRSVGIFADQPLSTPENSLGWLTVDEIQQAYQQGLNPADMENYANALVRNGNAEKAIANEPEGSRDYLQKVVDRINTIRSYLTKDMINKIHEENVRAAESGGVSIESSRSALRMYAKREYGLDITDPGSTHILSLVHKYTEFKDIGISKITPEIWKQALDNWREANKPPLIDGSKPRYDQRFKFDPDGNNIEAQTKPMIVAKAEWLLKEFQAGENGYRTVGTNPETGERIPGSVASTNVPFYRDLFEPGNISKYGTPSRGVIENAIKAIIKDPSKSTGKWFEYLMDVIDDSFSGLTDKTFYSSFDPNFQWVVGNKNDVAAYFASFIQADSYEQTILNTQYYFGTNQKLVDGVISLGYRWIDLNPEIPLVGPDAPFREDGQINPMVMRKTLTWQYGDLRDALAKAIRKNEMLTEASIENKNDVWSFNGKPIANATPGTNLQYVNGINYQLLGYDINDPTKLVVYLPDEQRVIKIPQTQEQARVTGSTPPGKSPGVIDYYEVLKESYNKNLAGALDQVGERFKQENQSQIPGIGKVDPETLAEIQAWINRLPTQMASINLASQRHGEMMRDGALLNYSWRYGADNYLTAIFPYQFWYTRTMMQWGKRMIDRPAWFAMYARLKEMQEETASKGIPARFAGKMRAYAPWLPEWAGTSMFSDPLSQAFPLEIYTNLGETMKYQISSIDRETQQNLLDMVDNAQITREQYDAAMANKNDPVYTTAYEEARKKSDMYNPVSLASMMMQPSMWIMDANYLASGTPEKMTVLPITKTSRAVGTALKGTPLEFLGNIIEAVGAGPETSIRKSAGLSPYGTWGDYYIDRELANLVADGKFTATEAMIAMIDRKGDAFTEAENRVKTQDMYKVPLSSALQSIAKTVSGTGDVKSLAPAIISSAMPFSVLPEGEMIQRGLAVEYKKAWDMMKAGDLKAINKFFEEHPEYQARLAINKDPDERMKQLLIDQIWNQYNQIPSATKKMVAEGLGDKFQTNFLNTATHDYETIDIPTLAYWAQALGGQIPDKAGKVPQYQLPKIETYTPAMTKAITDYKNEKNKLYPMVDIQQQMYFDKGKDKSILASFPQIKDYWDWKKKYEASHPVLKPYFEANREIAKEPAKIETEPYNPGNFALTPEQMKLFSPSLVKMIVADSTAGQELGEGAVAGLRLIWENLGKPDDTLENWYKTKVKPTFGK